MSHQKQNRSQRASRGGFLENHADKKAKRDDCDDVEQEEDPDEENVAVLEQGSARYDLELHEDRNECEANQQHDEACCEP
jgi:hypothetical protein